VYRRLELLALRTESTTTATTTDDDEWSSLFVLVVGFYGAREAPQR
jgi:hypothetical protein